MPESSVEQLREWLWSKDVARSKRVWTILDGARDPGIFRLVSGCYEDNCCLYSGSLPRALQLAAPYLVALEPDSHVTNYLLKHEWGKSWGVFLRSDASLDQLRRHLRRLLVVRDEGGSRLLFRFYDPRVLRLYLPTCLLAELRLFFGPIHSYLVEGEQPGSAARFVFDGEQLTQGVLDLRAAAA